jgi:hypothetical protein
VSENCEITPVRVTRATNCRALERYMSISYVTGHERAKSLFGSVYRIYFVRIDKTLIWTCKVQLVFIKECDLVFEDLEVNTW